MVYERYNLKFSVSSILEFHIKCHLFKKNLPDLLIKNEIGFRTLPCELLSHPRICSFILPFTIYISNSCICLLNCQGLGLIFYLFSLSLECV